MHACKERQARHCLNGDTHERERERNREREEDRGRGGEGEGERERGYHTALSAAETGGDGRCEWQSRGGPRLSERDVADSMAPAAAGLWPAQGPGRCRVSAAMTTAASHRVPDGKTRCESVGWSCCLCRVLSESTRRSQHRVPAGQPSRPPINPPQGALASTRPPSPVKDQLARVLHLVCSCAGLPSPKSSGRVSQTALGVLAGALSTTWLRCSSRLSPGPHSLPPSRSPYLGCRAHDIKAAMPRAPPAMHLLTLGTHSRPLPRRDACPPCATKSWSSTRPAAASTTSTPLTAALRTAGPAMASRSAQSTLDTRAALTRPAPRSMPLPTPTPTRAITAIALARGETCCPARRRWPPSTLLPGCAICTRTTHRNCLSCSSATAVQGRLRTDRLFTPLSETRPTRLPFCFLPVHGTDPHQALPPLRNPISHHFSHVCSARLKFLRLMA